jgi:SprT-like family
MSDDNTVLTARSPETGPAFAVDGAGDCSVHSTGEIWNVHSNDAVDGAGGKSPTPETYGQFQTAYDYLNSELFENKLPRCLITLQRQRSSYGYFSADRFGRKDGERTDEIALNPKHLASRPVEDSLSTLAHEMKHLEQQHFGTPGRGRYHNKEWAGMMEAIGLIPSDTGKEGGKRTGDAVSRYIKPGGRFALAVEKLLAAGFEITWREVAASRSPTPTPGAEGSEGRGEGASGKRTKFTCPVVGCQNAWAKPSASLTCAIHQKQMLPAD